MKNLNKKTLIIAGTIASILLIAGLVFVSKQDNVTELVTIEYGEKINDDEITPLIGKNEMPEIDTKAMGETEYVLPSGRTLIVTVEDTQKPVFKGDDKFTTEFGVAIKLEDKVTAEDPIDGKLKVEFTKVDYKKAGDQKVTATATDVNGNVSTKEITVIVKEEVMEVVEEVIEVVEETTSTNDYTPNNDYTPSNNDSDTGYTPAPEVPSTPSVPETNNEGLVFSYKDSGTTIDVYHWSYNGVTFGVVHEHATGKIDLNYNNGVDGNTVSIAVQKTAAMIWG